MACKKIFWIAGLIFCLDAVPVPAENPAAVAPTNIVVGVPARTVLAGRPPIAAVSYTLEERAAFQASSPLFAYDHVRMHELAVNTGWPLYLGESWRLFSGLGVQWYQFAFQGADSPSGRTHTKNTYVISMPFRLAIPMPENWRGMVMLSPGIYSDLEHVTSEDLRYAGMALATYNWSPELDMSAGLVYSRMFGREMLFPAAGLVWHPSPEWSVNMMFPRPALIYKPIPRLRLSALAMPAGNEWNISDDFEGDTAKYDFRFKGWRTGLNMEYALTSRLAVNCAAGLVFRREYELRRDNAKVAEADIGETWFVQIGLALR